ncbi:O-antigen ligase family protein [bacterium]|nr:O-antigen ligase family protein [bacterium]
MINKLGFKKIVFLTVMGTGSGVILFQSMSLDAPFMGSLAVLCVLLLPFLLIWPVLARDVLVAVLTLTLPFNIDQTFNLHPNHIGGAKGYVISISGIAIVMLYLLYLIEIYRNREKHIKWFPVSTFPLLGLLLMCILSLANAPDRLLGFYEILEILKMACILLYIANYIQDQKRFQFVVTLLVAGLFLESTVAILQRLTGTTLNLRIFGSSAAASMQQIEGDTVFRVGGTLGGPNALAWYLDFLLPLGFALLFYHMRTLFRMILIVVLVLGAASLIITLSRGGWLGFIVGIIFIALFHVHRLTLLKRIYLALFLILLMLTGSIVLLKTENPVRTRLISDDMGSVNVRIPLMKVAYNMIKENPFIGHGINNYALVHHQFDDTPEQVTMHFPYPVHNIYLQLTAEVGLPGLLFLLFFIVHLYYRFIKAIPDAGELDRSVFIGMTGALTAGLIQGMVENSTIGQYHLLPFWFLCGVAVGRQDLYNRQRVSDHPKNQSNGNFKST